MRGRPYARFNIGVALVRKERVDDAARLLDAVGQIEAPTEELAALRDKANLALGFAWLKADRPADAKAVLQRVRLEGPQSNKALLGAGWADSAEKRLHESAGSLARVARPQSARRCRAGILSRGPVRLRATRCDKQAAEQYMLAVTAFGEESQRIDQSIASIKSGALLDAIVSNDKGEASAGTGSCRICRTRPRRATSITCSRPTSFRKGSRTIAT